jgi:hypothetical protein
MPERLIMCTLCQRIQLGEEWVDMEYAIRESRSYELDSVPQLHGVICDDCRDSLARRRSQSGETLAA